MNLGQLMYGCHHLDEARATEYLPLLSASMECADIAGHALREAAYGATLAHESNGLTQFTEVSPHAQAYVSQALGNVDLNDARRYIGHGPGQITGKRNHQLIGDRMHVDFIAHPEWLALPEYGFMGAAEYWMMMGCAHWADADNFRVVSSLWNNGHVAGPINGWDSRQTYYQRFRNALLGDQHGITSDR